MTISIVDFNISQTIDLAKGKNPGVTIRSDTYGLCVSVQVFLHFLQEISVLSLVEKFGSN